VPAIGFGILWSGYTLMFWGFCKVKGYDISLGEIVIPKKYTGKWPPKLIDDGSTDGAYGGQLGGPNGEKRGGNGVKPGQHPGDKFYKPDPGVST
jgi:hypothetical protein